MAVRMADTAEPMGDFPIAKAKHIEFEDGEKLQEKLDNGTFNGNMTIQDGSITANKLSDDAGDGLIGEGKYSANLFNKANVVNDKYLVENGTETSDANYSYGTDYIPVDMAKTYAFTGCYGKNQQAILYDENKAYVGTVYKDKCTGTAGKSLVCDFSKINKPTARYIRLNTTTGKLDIYMFVQADSYPTEYIPFKYIPGGLKSSKLQSAIETIVDSKSSSLEGITIGETVNVNGNDQLIAIGTNTPTNTSLPAVAIGYGALQNNMTTGSDDTGRFNVAVGSSTLNANTTGNHNTAVGYQAMRKNTTGNGNTGIGEDACIANTTGNGNTGVGRYTLFTNAEGSDNVAVGLNASYLLESSKNTAVGASAGRSNKTGEGNTYLGYYANGDDAITNATAIGNQAYVKESNAIQLGNSDVKKVYTWGDIQIQRNGAGIILLSPDGTKYKLTIDNNGKLLFDGKEMTSYDDTQVKADIQANADDILTNTNDIQAIKTKIGTTAMGTTATDVTGAVAEVNGNQLDTVSFSADYKNILLNRKNGTNPYTIPIAAIINHAKLIELEDVDTTDIGNGKILVYDSATQKHKYADSTGTDEFVKMDSTTDAHYLADLIDKQTIVNDNGVLKVKKLDGQDVTITEINYLKGLTMNVMDLVNTFANGGVKVHNAPVATYADLTTLDRSTFLEGISYIVYVLADETHAGAKTTYLCDKTSSTYFGNADSQRNFTTNPIDLANEVTGKLPAKNIDVDSLWALLTVDDTYKTLTATDNAFGTHGAKAMYDELVAAIGNKANAVDLTAHTDDTDIHITTDERTKWDKVINKVDTTDFNTHKNDTDIHITSAERTKWDKINTDLTTHTGDTDIHTSATEKASYVKKTDITTSIDSTSTDTQVPSAKAVFNSITSISAGSIQDNLTSLVLVTNLNDFKGSSFMIGRGTANSTANIPNGIDGAFVIEYIPYDNGDRYGVQRITLVQSTNNNYSTFERSLSNNTWRSWKELVTMDKVERFSTTEIPIGTWINGKTIYRIYTSFPAFEMKPYEWNTVNSLSITGIDEVIDAKAKRSEDNAIIPLAVRSRDTSIEVNPSSNFGISKLILEYTKQ